MNSETQNTKDKEKDTFSAKQVYGLGLIYLFAYHHQHNHLFVKGWTFLAQIMFEICILRCNIEPRGLEALVYLT